MHITTNALVLREVAYKESDKILTILTEDMGKLTVSARGCRKKNSTISAGCQILSWSQFVLYEYKGRFTVKEVAVEESFPQIPSDVLRFSLGCYFAEVGEVLAIENLPQQDLLSLLLNCLYVLDKKPTIPLDVVKSVFELRAISQSGYEPMIEECVICQNPQPQRPQLSLMDGTIHCYHCGGKAFPVSSLSALHYILKAPPKKIFQFQLEDSKNLASLSEAYLLAQLDRPFKTLDYYHMMKKL